MKSSTSESKPVQSRCIVEIPGWARQEERLSGSKLKQAFLIDSDAELFMYLHLCSSMYQVRLMKISMSQPGLNLRFMEGENQ